MQALKAGQVIKFAVDRFGVGAERWGRVLKDWSPGTGMPLGRSTTDCENWKVVGVYVQENGDFVLGEASAVPENEGELIIIDPEPPTVHA